MCGNYINIFHNLIENINLYEKIPKKAHCL